MQIRFVRECRKGARAADLTATERAGDFQHEMIAPALILCKEKARGMRGEGGIQKWTRQVLRCHVTVRWARSILFAFLNHARYIRVYWVRALNHFNQVSDDERCLPRSGPRRG